MFSKVKDVDDGGVLNRINGVTSLKMIILPCVVWSWSSIITAELVGKMGNANCPYN